MCTGLAAHPTSEAYHSTDLFKGPCSGRAHRRCQGITLRQAAAALPAELALMLHQDIGGVSGVAAAAGSVACRTQWRQVSGAKPRQGLRAVSRASIQRAAPWREQCCKALLLATWGSCSIKRQW